MQISKDGDMYHVVSDKSGPWGYVQVKIDHGDELSPENERLFIENPIKIAKELNYSGKITIHHEASRSDKPTKKLVTFKNGYIQHCLMYFRNGDYCEYFFDDGKITNFGPSVIEVTKNTITKYFHKSMNECIELYMFSLGFDVDEYSGFFEFGRPNHPDYIGYNKTHTNFPLPLRDMEVFIAGKKFSENNTLTSDAIEVVRFEEQVKTQ